MASAWRRRHAARRTDRLQGPGLLPEIRLCLLLLRAGPVRRLRRHHVGDRALTVRQGAAGDPRQRDPRRLSSASALRRYRWIAFVISGCFTGLAGVLWVPLNGLTTPEILYWPFSGEIVFMTVLGGFRTFTGPIVGAIAFNYLKVYAVASSEYWQMLLGVCSSSW